MSQSNITPRQHGMLAKQKRRVAANQLRENVRTKFNGRCAYCGEILQARWHIDHFDAVYRENGKMLRPENHNIANLMPACAPCNIDKSVYPLEEWRQKLQNAIGALTRHNSTYRHAKRFGLITETGVKVVFYFERLQNVTE